ncbi:uncharacterized protein LOC111276863 [Durio zibethinus]|uniref:Uncharacterized protein LOC111276863 n=1 Tax=Durio zibethinus TaxID=66656 RepID=A0A6P5WS51_DURZI|nr:uncharacterized protein LOC111276863 [Durio zibethinus]
MNDRRILFLPTYLNLTLGLLYLMESLIKGKPSSAYHNISITLKSFLRCVINKFDFYKREWIEVKSIGNNAIFLTDQCYGSCSSVAEESDIRRNSIYYTQYEDRNLYVYDLEDRSVTTSLPCPIVSRRKSSYYWSMLPMTNNS